jgi:hypothetical protein
MDPLVVATVGSSLLSVAAMVVATFRRRTAVTLALQADLDIAVEQNKRLVAELAAANDRNHALELKVTPEKLSEHARIGVAYAEQMGGTSEQKLRHALGASIISDKGANGQQDWTDAQHRIAIEAALQAKK